MLDPKPCAVVSYADSEQSHCGFIYQATNWTYTGAVVAHESVYIVDGKRTHSMTLYDKGITAPKEWARENNVQIVKPHPKHRYFYFCGSKHQKKTMLSKLKYPIVNEYPKMNPNRYDDGPILDVKAQPQIRFITDNLLGGF